MFWLNVDHPTNIWKLHKADCVYSKPNDSTRKGVNTTKEEGGWFKFRTHLEAHEFYKKIKPRAVWQPCKICKPED
ncbi:MAG: hypothetical protein NWE89_13395 [Candidatus Bathyarchaeota archaeon]|nr:hypothetical protein [Candidatus Bathyarchaeota archaeon]